MTTPQAVWAVGWDGGKGHICVELFASELDARRRMAAVLLIDRNAGCDHILVQSPVVDTEK